MSNFELQYNLSEHVLPKQMLNIKRIQQNQDKKNDKTTTHTKDVKNGTRFPLLSTKH